MGFPGFLKTYFSDPLELGCAEAAADAALPDPGLTSFMAILGTTPASSRPNLCQWCSREMSSAQVCPSCHAVYNPDLADEEIPGLTQISEELLQYAAQALPKKKTGLLASLF
jgi:hypothetical protein